jgi:hypothetical protein
MFLRSNASIPAGRPGLLRNVRTLSRITAAVTLALSLLSIPYHLARQQDTSAKPAYSLRKVQLDGFANSVVYAVNQRGEALGAAWKNDNDTAHPFIWRDGKATELDKPNGASEVFAVALNDKQESTGAALMADDSVVGVLWRGRKVVSTLALAGQDVFPTAINDAGQVTGTHSEPG